MQLKKTLSGLLAAFAAVPAMAQEGLEVIGQPIPGGIGFQPAATELMRDIRWLDGMLNIIITVITLFVTALIIYCIVRYNRKSNPTPGTFTHNSPFVVAWTVICTAIHKIRNQMGAALAYSGVKIEVK